MLTEIHTHLSVWTYVEEELTLTDASGNLLLLSVFIGLHAHTHTRTQVHTLRSIYTEAGENTKVLCSEKLLQTISDIKEKEEKSKYF